jgi:hypothetical protein
MPQYLRVERSDARRRCSNGTCKRGIPPNTRHLVSSYPYSRFPHYRRSYCKLCVLRAVLGFLKWSVPGWQRQPFTRCACGRVKQRHMGRCFRCQQLPLEVVA